MPQCAAQIINLLQADASRMAALKAVSKLELPDCWLAAGFIRNMVWDAMHGYSGTPLNDHDVIFYDPDGERGEMARVAEERLRADLPGQNWQVRNQALMHSRNGDTPYRHSADAMSFWPEIETAVGARLNTKGKLELLAPFGTESLFVGHITHNPKRPYALFISRVTSKKWLQHWSKLRIVA